MLAFSALGIRGVPVAGGYHGSWAGLKVPGVGLGRMRAGLEDMAAAGMLTMESANGVVTLRLLLPGSRRQAS